MSVVKSEGGPAASMKPGQESSVRSSEIITLLAQWPSEGSGFSWTHPEHSWTDPEHINSCLKINN
jgi:hypothetical protein